MTTNDHEYIDEENSDQFEQKVKKIKKQLKQTQKEAKEYLDGWQRERADFANYKKEVTERQQNVIFETKTSILLKFLEVIDNFELIVKHAPKDIQKTDWYKGVEQVNNQAHQVLKQWCVEKMDIKLGDEFDPHRHEAAEGKGEKIAEILQPGYTINNDKVLRAAKVKVE